MMIRKKNKLKVQNTKSSGEQLYHAELWIERNQGIILGGLVILVCVIGGYFGFHYYIGKQEHIAQRDMFQAVYYFEQDSLNIALKGDGNNLGFEQIINEYGMTDAANLARYYTGVINLKQGEFLSAIDYLSDFTSDDMLVQARAYSLIGDSYMELENYKSAATYYKKASNHQPNKFFTPSYMLKEALSYEKLNDNKNAQKTYQKIIDQYWDTDESLSAEKFKAQLHL